MSIGFIFDNRVACFVPENFYGVGNRQFVPNVVSLDVTHNTQNLVKRKPQGTRHW